ncbi:MAG: 5'-nucleotidase C-terminal domain-containing protein [Candidatus Gastranaerophilales bacterium]|nr:5'-nucleotidase C-terminal domain-containing protein [Candidatus Gastranaerophilales bacterium]
MISFSSGNIQSTRRSGYVRTHELPQLGASDNRQPVKQQQVQNTKPEVKEVYSKPISSPSLNYFVSNIGYKSSQEQKKEHSPLQSDGSIKLKIGYLNDLHGQYMKLEKIADALRDCDIRFSGGDNMIGDDRNQKVNECICKYMDAEDIEASALGNHDVDMSQKNFEELTKNLNMKYLASNFRQDSASKENVQVEKGAYIHDKLVDSYIGDYKGVKYGVIGIAPCDMRVRMTHPDFYDDFEVDDLPETIKGIQKEADDLKEQGIDKIFLLSHVGHLSDRVIAENTSGIDVIIGGHSHTYVDGIRPGENLFLSKTREPVLITNAEKDGNYYGKSELVFDKDGVIINATNTLYDTSKRHKNLIYKKLFDDIIGTPEKLGVIKSVIPAPKQRLSEESAHANFVAEAIRNELNVDIGIVNAGNIRNSFETGAIDTSDVKAISPFGDGMVICPINEKDLVDGIKAGCKSVTDKNGKPGLIYAAGLKYSVKKDTGELLSMTYTDRAGNETPVDVNNPDPNKVYRVAADDFILSGGDGIPSLNHLDEAEQKFDFSEDKLISDYIKHLNKPVEINQTGIINIVD